MLNSNHVTSPVVSSYLSFTRYHCSCLFLVNFHRRTFIYSIMFISFDSHSPASRPAFVSSVVPNSPVGLPPVRSSSSSTIHSHHREPKFKSEDVTFRHKKWLAAFQERRAKHKDEFSKREEKKEEKKRIFQEKCQDMRDTIRDTKLYDPENIQGNDWHDYQ